MGIVVNVVKALRVIVPRLIGVAYLTLAERKVMGAIQRRQGPNAVGLYGRFTPLADGLKLFLKETVVPASSNPGLFVGAPRVTFVLALMGWAVMPIGEGRVYADPSLGMSRTAIASIGSAELAVAHGYLSAQRRALK